MFQGTGYNDEAKLHHIHLSDAEQITHVSMAQLAQLLYGVSNSTSESLVRIKMSSIW